MYTGSATGLPSNCDELARLVEPDERRRKPVRCPQQMKRPRGRRRTRAWARAAGERTRRRRGPRTNRSHRCDPAADPAGLHDYRGGHDGDRLNEDVPVPNVCQFMRKHALELRGRERLQEAAADRDRRAARTAAGRTGSRKAVAHDVQARLGRRPPAPRAARRSSGALPPRRAGAPARRRARGRPGRRTTTSPLRPEGPRTRRSGTGRSRSSSQPIPPRSAQITKKSAQTLRRFRAIEQPARTRLRRSSSVSPRGGQSGSGASQRLEQWSEAMFCRGTRMWPFSSMCATSSTKQYAVSTPSW